MRHRIVVANQKGGTGKTTTAINLAGILAEEFNLPTLLIDFDPQGHATQGLGFDRYLFDESETVAAMLLKPEDEYSRLFVKTKVPNLTLIPANIDLAGVDARLLAEVNREWRLARALDNLETDFDILIVDTTPALGALAYNAFCACNEVIIPVDCGLYALHGLNDLMESIRTVRELMNKHLRILGTLVTRYDARTNFAQDVYESVKSYFPDGTVFRNYIPNNVKVAEAPQVGQPIHQYDHNCAGYKAYRAVAEEILARWGETGEVVA